MKTPSGIYAEYKIMPSLQLHQLRVAAVAQLICDNFQKPVSKNDVILACLFHDMGNIIKSDLTYFPEFVEPEGLEYWEKIKADFVLKYGENHHKANVMIAKDLGLPPTSIALIDSIGFSQLEFVVADDSFERKIMQYADIRVGPHGILPLKQRLEEGRKRYNTTRKARMYYESDEEFEHLAQFAGELEKQVSEHMHITPDKIDDTAIKPIIEQLKRARLRDSIARTPE